MTLRREILSYLGTGTMGAVAGYYAGVQGLLGLQSGETGGATGAGRPTETAESTPTERGETARFEDTFTTADTGYDPEKWRVIKKTRFEGEDATGDRFTQTGDDQLEMSPQSYESVYLESRNTFSPPVEMTINIASATPQYGSAADLGFAMPGETYPGRGGERSGRGRMFKWTTDSAHLIYNQDGKISVFSQKDSPLHNEGDAGRNQSGDGSWKDDISDTAITLSWTSEEASLRVGDRTYTTTENIPTDPMPLYLTGIEWVGSEAVVMTLNNVNVTPV